MSNWFEVHLAKLNKALDACQHRYSWTAYTESPSSKIHGTEAPKQGKARFEARLNQDYPLHLPGEVGRTGEEVSPYTQAPLGITYPKVDVDELYKAINLAQPAWTKASVETRVGVCMEILERCAGQLFENAHATMHTAGQSYIMAFAGSGANALDRGLEALAYAYKAMKDVPQSASWTRTFGAAGDANLHKEYRLKPRGVSVTVCCATFPLWNGYPALTASLATGNPVVLKPHPSAILPVALMVSVCRDVLGEAGFDPNLVTMVADTRQAPATMALLNHPDSKIIDFTGSPTFGQWIEQHCRHALVYTETAGCNSVVIESSTDLTAMATAIAQSLCQASAQMCTSVQNIHIPAQGVKIDGEPVSFDTIASAIVDAVDNLLGDPKQAAFLCGALVTQDTYATLEHYTEIGKKVGSVLRGSTAYNHPDYPQARTATPLIIALDDAQREHYRQELFGPISFIIKSPNAEACLIEATQNARECGAITSHVYSTDAAFLAQAEDAYNDAGASVACNLIGMPINFAAAYSDYHVTGMNPAGNACLTDLAFVANRFRIVQRKRMI
ncbi:phenylacetic acid degradation protein PaaN [Paraglaciecola chathamensis]|uniref:Phenylacetic acid degradation protein PaaN n=1 Tax=Paraglaciecola chathamensis TaxID=368405 RepID=A0A8H9IAP3_9ALTE|nr:phenylacetic acid degradation protein PaaN [Paraglaciecola oceanifecundans]GGZ64090.1 phenylacetic acid degradation protein PaaN [Paraglaciecola oceanifecundans]